MDSCLQVPGLKTKDSKRACLRDSGNVEAYFSRDHAFLLRSLRFDLTEWDGYVLDYHE